MGPSAGSVGVGSSDSVYLRIYLSIYLSIAYLSSIYHLCISSTYVSVYPYLSSFSPFLSFLSQSLQLADEMDLGKAIISEGSARSLYLAVVCDQTSGEHQTTQTSADMIAWSLWVMETE